jgi:hypothetical protein
MLLHPEMSRKRRGPDQPQREEIAAIKGEIEKARQIKEEGV